jgi:hypothetical protein
MARSPVADEELARLGKFHGTIERNANIRQQAFNHNLGRNLRVLKVLAYLDLLRQAGAPLSGVINCAAAIRQNFSSSQTGTQMGLLTGPMQAAHFLPGQINVDGQPLWFCAKEKATRGQIEFLFAEVEHLPAVFNQADSAAEMKGNEGGLCAALTTACQTMVQVQVASAVKAITPSRLATELLEKAYGDWHRKAITALQIALAGKRSGESLPPLGGNRFEGYTPESIAARSAAESSVWNREFSADVLKYYLADQQQRGWAWVVSGCQSALREVESGFKP